MTACGSTRAATRAGTKDSLRSARTLAKSVSGSAQDIALGDVDGDGDLDAWMAYPGDDGRDYLYINQGGAQGGAAGEFADSDQAFQRSYGVDLGDVDGDGDLDAFVGVRPNQVLSSVWINQGGDQGGTEGVFVDGGQVLPRHRYSKSYGKGIALGDLDADGDLDAFVAYTLANSRRAELCLHGTAGAAGLTQWAWSYDDRRRPALERR